MAHVDSKYVVVLINEFIFFFSFFFMFYCKGWHHADTGSEMISYSFQVLIS